MANFNEKINYGIGYNTNSKEFLIYRRGSIVPCFRIPAEVLEHFFGLKENLRSNTKSSSIRTLMSLSKLDDTLRKLK